MKQFKKSVIALAAMAVVTASSVSAPLAGAVPYLSELSISASAATNFTSGNFTCTKLSDTTAAITGYKGTSTEVVIPAKVNNLKVTEIAKGAFDSKVAITSVDCTAAPLVRINGYAFRFCQNLNTVKLPASVKYIDEYAFAYCSRMTSVRITGNSELVSIGDYAFYECWGLTTFKSDDKALYAQNYRFYDHYIIDTTPFVIPPKVTSVGKQAFSGCDKMTSLYLFPALKNVGKDAFPYRKELHIHFTENDKGTDNPSASYAPVSITVSNRKMTCADGNVYTFSTIDSNDVDAGLIVNCIELKNTQGKVTIPDTVIIDGTTFKVCELADNILQDNLSVKTITMGDNIKKIGAGFCSGAEKLTTLKLSKSLEKAGSFFLYYCKALDTIKFEGTNLQEVEGGSFWGSKWYKYYKTKYPKADAMVLGNYLIQYFGDEHSGNNSQRITVNCASLWTGDNNDSSKVAYKQVAATAIHSIAFSTTESTPNVVNIDVTNVKSIHDEAFRNCKKLDTVYNTESIEHLGKNLFSDETYAKLKKASSDQNYVAFGSVIYEWTGEENAKQTNAKLKATADLSKVKNLSFLSSNVFANAPGITTLKLPNSVNLKIEDDFFQKNNITSLYYSGYEFTYQNVNVYRPLYEFYCRNYAILEDTPLIEKNFIVPMCKDILEKNGLPCYLRYDDAKKKLVADKMTFAKGMTAEDKVLQQTKTVGTLYRYLSNKFRYTYTVGTSGAYTLYTNKGQCGPSARSFAILLNAAGLNAGITGSSNHGWTVVKLGNAADKNEQWYNLDVCDGWQNITDMFLKSESEIANISCHENIHCATNDPSLVKMGLVGTYHEDNSVYFMGDANQDGKFNATDITLMEKYLNNQATGSTFTKAFLDLDGNGEVNGVDYMLMQQKITE